MIFVILSVVLLVLGILGVAFGSAGISKNKGKAISIVLFVFGIILIISHITYYFYLVSLI